MGQFKFNVEIAGQVPAEFSEFVQLNVRLIAEVDKLFYLQLSPELGVYRGDVQQVLACSSDYKTEPYSVLSAGESETREIPYHEAYDSSISEILPLLTELSAIVEKIDRSDFALKQRGGGLPYDVG